MKFQSAIWYDALILIKIGKAESELQEMRANKKAIIWTALITVVCLGICIILYLNNNHNLLYDLSLACFGSALLGIVVATTAYLAERRDAMEHFTEEMSKGITVLDKIPIIEISDVVCGALRDENNWIEKTTENSDKLKNDIETKLPINENTTKDQINEWVETAYQSELKEARRQLRKGAEAYVAVGNYDLSNLSNAYGRLDFLFGNETIRKQAYQDLYDKFRTFRLLCLDQCRALKPYIAGNEKEIVCLNRVLFLQEQVFEKRDDCWYAKLRDELVHSLETFRSQIYNIKPEYEEPYPVQYIINFESPKSAEKEKPISGKNK